MLLGCGSACKAQSPAGLAETGLITQVACSCASAFLQFAATTFLFCFVHHLPIVIYDPLFGFAGFSRASGYLVYMASLQPQWVRGRATKQTRGSKAPCPLCFFYSTGFKGYLRHHICYLRSERRYPPYLRFTAPGFSFTEARSASRVAPTLSLSPLSLALSEPVVH